MAELENYYSIHAGAYIDKIISDAARHMADTSLHVNRFADLADVKGAGAPSAGKVWGYDGSAYAWLTVGGGGASSWSELSDRPTWLDDYTGSIPYTRFENFTGNQVTLYVGNDAKTLLISSALDGYAKKTDLASYATQAWVEQRGYLTEHQSLAGYATETWASGQFLGKNDKAKSAEYTSDLIPNNSWLSNLNSPSWSVSFGITVQEYNLNASNRPCTDDNANYLINIGGDKHGTAYPYGWQLSFSDNDKRMFARYCNPNGFYDWHQFAFLDDVVVKSKSIEFLNYNDCVAARFHDTNIALAQKAANTYIEWWDPSYFWFNFALGSLEANGLIKALNGIEVEGYSKLKGGIFAPWLELSSDSPYIDFHQGSSTSDYTARIVGWPAYPGVLEFYSKNDKPGTIKLGNACITYDETNKALKVYGADGTQMHLYTTGDIGGFSNVGAFKTLDEINITKALTVGDEIKIGRDIAITKNGGIKNGAVVWDGTIIHNTSGSALYFETDFDIVGEVGCSNVVTGTLDVWGNYRSDVEYGLTELSHSGNYIYLSFKNSGGNNERYRIIATRV